MTIIRTYDDLPLPILHCHKWVCYSKHAGERALKLDYMWVCEWCSEVSLKPKPDITGCEPGVGKRVEKP